MKLKLWIWFSVGIIAALAASAYWYVFIADAPQLDAVAVVEEPGLSFRLESFESQAIGTSRQYGLILPPGYQKHPHERYPVIFLLHGGHDDATAYEQKYAIGAILQELYQHKKLPPSIVIMPDGNDNRGSNPIWDPAYFDGPRGKLGTLIGSELVQEVKTRYRTAESPRLWAMGGISSGGWGAFNIGLRHLDRFNVLFSHSGYFTDSSGAENSPQSFVSQVVADLSPQQRQNLRFYLDAGQSDSDFVASSQQFHQTLNRLQVENTFHVFPGGHGLSGADYGWNYFRKHLVDSLSYVGAQFKQAELS